MTKQQENQRYRETAEGKATNQASNQRLAARRKIARAAAKAERVAAKAVACQARPRHRLAAFVLETRAKTHAQRVAELLSAEDLAAAVVTCAALRCPCEQ
jgi:hypothetical protein